MQHHSDARTPAPGATSASSGAGALPPDRGGLRTEQRNPRSMDLHRLSARACVELIAREDRAVLDAVEDATPAIAALVEAVEPGFLRGGRVVYLGAGTSGRLGVLDASEAPPTFCVPPGRIVGIIAGGDAALRKSSEGREDEPLGAVPELDALALTRDDAVIGIAAGGTTPYVLGALAWCARRGERAGASRPVTALLACTPLPATPEGVDHLVVLDTGPEVLTGSTRMKAGSATKMTLNMISTTLMVRSGRVYENLMVDVRATNAKLRDRAARIVGALTGLDRAAALSLVDAAGGSAKTAIVMARLRVSRVDAEGLLERAGGRLEAILDADAAAPRTP